jgi:hypothetical protein
MLAELKETDLFRIDGKFDFLWFEEVILILDRKHFESGLNLRTGMKRKAEAALGSMQSLQLFVDVELLKSKCLDNLRYLRRLSTIEKRGLYKASDFLIRLKKVSDAENWDIVFEEGKISITSENLDSVLSVLADQRLKSLVTGTTYDADLAREFRAQLAAQAPIRD